MNEMRYLLLLIFVPPCLLGIAGAAFTSRKLERMEMIRGWRPGATARIETVRQKLEDPKGGTCWITIEDRDIRKPGPHRLNLDPEKWDELKVGDPIEIVHVPGDDSPHTRDGIYVSDGNFTFDRVLLGIEIAMIAGSVIGALVMAAILMRRPRRRLLSS